MKFRKQALFTIVAIAILGGSTIAVPARPACNSAAFQAILDNAFATGPAGEPSSAVGYTATVQSPSCFFLGSVGSARIERFEEQALTPANRMWIGSLTKMFTAFQILKLVEQGQLNIDATVNQFFTAQELGQLTAGCTNDCPNFSTITIRQLLNATHNLRDFITMNRNNNGFPDFLELNLERLAQLAGVPTIPPPLDDNSPFETLVALGVRRDLNFVGFELPNFGNTGYQLLDIILERVSGKPFREMVKEAGFGFGVLNDGPVQFLDADSYTVTTGALQALGVPENFFGLYGAEDTPHGHTAINTRNFDHFPGAGLNSAAGSITAKPLDYVSFLRKLVNGELLGPVGQSLFNNAFVPVPDNIAQPLTGETGVSHGFGVFKTSGPGGTTVLFKTGGTLGSFCHARHVVERNATVLVCRNSRDLFPPQRSANPENIARQMVNELLK